MHQKLLKYSKPSLTPVEQVIINVNLKCFFKCKMCAIWKNQNGDLKLTVQTYDRFFKDLKDIKGPDTEIQFAGGEPLATKEIYDIIKSASKYNFKTCLNTNGWLVNKKNIKKLYDCGLNVLIFSLDGSNPDVHDNIRGMPGSFKRIMNAIKIIENENKIRKEKLHMVINTVISKMNLNDVQKIVDLIESIDSIDKIWLQAVASPLNDPNIFDDDKILLDKNNWENWIYWFEHKKYEHLWPKNKKELTKLYTELIYRLKEGSKIDNNKNRLLMQYNYFLHPETRAKDVLCTVFKDIMVGPEGDVFFCPVRKEKIGNINQHSIKEMWQNEKSHESRNNVINCDRNCFNLINCGLPKDVKLKNAW